jgi:hypothetical protein
MRALQEALAQTPGLAITRSNPQMRDFDEGQERGVRGPINAPISIPLHPANPIPLPDWIAQAPPLANSPASPARLDASPRFR